MAPKVTSKVQIRRAKAGHRKSHKLRERKFFPSPSDPTQSPRAERNSAASDSKSTATPALAPCPSNSPAWTTDSPSLLAPWPFHSERQGSMGGWDGIYSRLGHNRQKASVEDRAD